MGEQIRNIRGNIFFTLENVMTALCGGKCS